MLSLYVLFNSHCICKTDNWCESTDDTIGDPLQKVRYDAFILYSNEDSEFADEVVTKLEHEYNLKVENSILDS